MFSKGKIEDAETLLRLLLLHVAGGLSLEQTSLRAREQGLATVSDVALFKRLRRSEAWLQALTAHVLATMPGSPLLSLGDRYRLRALDATFIQEPGSTGTDWRLHYSLRLPELVCDFFELTDTHGAEHLKRLPVRPGDVVLADRGYSRRCGAAAILRAGGELVLRLQPSGFPLLDHSGKPLDLLALLERKRLRPGAVLEVPVQFEHEGQRFKARLCVVRRSAAATEAARRKITAERTRKRGKVRPQTLAMAAYVCVLTTLPKSVATAEEALELYVLRARAVWICLEQSDIKCAKW